MLEIILCIKNFSNCCFSTAWRSI